MSRPPAPAGAALGRRRFLAFGLGAAATLAAACSFRPPKTEAPTPSLAGPPASPTPTETPVIPIVPGPPSGPNRVARENALPGTRAWEMPLAGRGMVEGYFGDVSVAPGDSLSLYAGSSAATINVEIYRLGWYAGSGARLVGLWRDVRVPSQPGVTIDHQTGLIRAPWSEVLRVTVPQDWVSGAYLAVLRPAGSQPAYAMFVVREPEPEAPILFVSAVTTAQAYNNWGGKSLYPVQSSGAPTLTGNSGAVKVSFDRPHARDRGAGDLLRWEYHFVRWQEARSYDVGYVADLDLGRSPRSVEGRRLIVIAGHPEYWSVAMRRTIEDAIGAGIHVAFFSGNEIYWRVRFEPSPLGPERTLVCYRYANLDPMATTDPNQTTNLWRDPPDPRPESLLIGQMYGQVVVRIADFVCTAPDHWIFAGTGLGAGDRIARLVGQEYDRYYPDAALHPPGTEILASSPVQPNLGGRLDLSVTGAPVHNSTIYTAPSGAIVFSAGTIQWAWGLDGWGSPSYHGQVTPVDWRVGRISANILDRLGS